MPSFWCWLDWNRLAKETQIPDDLIHILQNHYTGTLCPNAYEATPKNLHKAYHIV